MHCYHVNDANGDLVDLIPFCRKQKLAELRILATSSLKPLPHMATALATVRAEIRRLERNK